MNEVSIQLASSSRNALLESVPQDSEIWNALRYARFVHPNRRQYVVFCDRPGAEALLDVARRHCSDAAHEIELAIQRSPRLRA